MKKIEIKFQYNGTHSKVAVINDDINSDMVLADHPLNENVSVETGMADELGIWNINFQEPYMDIECDFISKSMPDGYEQLTLDPCEVVLWSNGGTCINTDNIPFTIEVTDL